MDVFNKKYKVMYVFYSNELACSRVTLLEDTHGIKYAAKQILKNKLNNKYFHEFARNELSLHSSLSKLSNTIVKVEEYFEDEEKYTMVMEYAHDPDYFEDLLENVSLMNIIM